MRLVRWIAYLAFVLIYPLFWFTLTYVDGGMHDPACVREPAGCVGPDWWRPYESLFVVVAALVLTLLAFLPYRRFILQITTQVG